MLSLAPEVDKSLAYLIFILATWMPVFIARTADVNPGLLEDTDEREQDDPFLYYSNDEVRMSTLKLQDITSEATSEKEISVDESPRSIPQRKTRLTFELHPLLVLNDWRQIYCTFDDNAAQIHSPNCWRRTYQAVTQCPSYCWVSSTNTFVCSSNVGRTCLNTLHTHSWYLHNWNKK